MLPPSARAPQVTLVVPSATYHIGPLAHEIDPAASSYTVSEFKVELALRKKIAGVQWGRLEGEEASIRASLSSAPTGRVSIRRALSSLPLVEAGLTPLAKVALLSQPCLRRTRGRRGRRPSTARPRTGPRSATPSSRSVPPGPRLARRRRLDLGLTLAYSHLRTASQGDIEIPDVVRSL